MSALISIFSIFLPKEDKFFPMFRRIGEATVEVLECEAVLNDVTGAYSAAAELEAVSVAVSVALAVLSEAVAESDTVLDSYHADRTCSFLGVEIPAVI